MKWNYFGFFTTGLFIILVQLPRSSCGPKNPVYLWGPWSSMPLSCSVTCGRGVRCRVRKCLNGFGNVQPSTELCSDVEEYESQSEQCITCVVNALCPLIPGWGEWGVWGNCMPQSKGGSSTASGCRVGVRSRSRLCNNPPPEPPPKGIPCMGSAVQIKECLYECEGPSDVSDQKVMNQIQEQIEEDHRLGMRTFKNVLRKRTGEKVAMNCATPAYLLAKMQTSVNRFSAAGRALVGKVFSITWLKNGRQLHTSGGESNFMMGKSQSKKYANEYLDEEERWNSLLSPSSSYVKDSYLIIPALHEGDQGFYTCELKFGNIRWMAIFYSLIVVGIHYTALIADAFYLHSNLGYASALNIAPAWLDASKLVWTLNGVEHSRGLAAGVFRRIQKINHLNFSHQGTWACYLIIPAPGTPAATGTPWSRQLGVFLINEFQLKVASTATTVWQYAEYPSSLRILRYVAVGLSLGCLVLLLFLLLTVWAVVRWTHRTLSADQRKAIIQEVVDNECRLLLTARERAGQNKNRLLPLILFENRKLEKTANFLTQRLTHFISTRVATGGADHSGATQSNIFNHYFRNFPNAFINASNSPETSTKLVNQFFDSNIPRINKRKQLSSLNNPSPLLERVTITLAAQQIENLPNYLEDDVLKNVCSSENSGFDQSRSDANRERFVAELLSIRRSTSDDSTRLSSGGSPNIFETSVGDEIGYPTCPRKSSGSRTSSAATPNRRHSGRGSGKPSVLPRAIARSNVSREVQPAPLQSETQKFPSQPRRTTSNVRPNVPMPERQRRPSHR